MSYHIQKIAEIFGERHGDLLEFIYPAPNKRGIFLFDTVGYFDQYEDEGIAQLALRDICAFNQKYKDIISREPLTNEAHLHHALITRSMVVKNKNGHLIHTAYNCMMLNPDIHLSGNYGADNREKCALLLGKVYGPTRIESWYWDFPTKTTFPDIFMPVF